MCASVRVIGMCVSVCYREDIRKIKKGCTEVNIGCGGQRKGARGWPPKNQDKLPSLKIRVFLKIVN